MRTAPSILFTLLMSASAFAFAQAPPPPAPVAAPAPAPAAGEDVSTMNGELVRVGDRHQYERGYKKINLSTNPLGLLWGSYGVSGSYAVHPQIALRADVNYYNPPGDDAFDVSGFDAGVGAPIYFRKMYTGLFLEPGFLVRYLSSDAADTSTTVFGPQVLFGYHWIWDSGLNIALAAGGGRNFNSSDDDAFADYDEVFVNGYMRVGWAFN